MSILHILKIIAAIGTIITGLVSLFWPRAVFGFIGLTAPGPRGITEIRAVLGGVFIALGAAPFLLKLPEAYQVLGITYLVVAAIRAVSMFIDHSIVNSNLISLAFEIVFGILLVLPL